MDDSSYVAIIEEKDSLLEKKEEEISELRVSHSCLYCNLHSISLWGFVSLSESYMSPLIQNGRMCKEFDHYCGRNCVLMTRLHRQGYTHADIGRAGSVG